MLTMTQIGLSPKGTQSMDKLRRTTPPVLEAPPTSVLPSGAPNVGSNAA